MCHAGSAPTSTPPGDLTARRSVQRGLQFLAKASRQWTEAHHCFGCHVQAVTMEALAVGKHHQYDVTPKDIDAMVTALQMGVTAGGHTTGVAFEGQAWARYDEWIDAKQTSTLLQYAEDLRTLQAEDGSIPDDDARLPVTGGTMHTTYQAMQTWRQAYARTANDRWLPPMRRAERYLAKRSEVLASVKAPYLQDLNLALLGLTAAGVGPAEAPSQRMQKALLARQNQDGGWGLEAGKSDALATGQTLYALKLCGHTDAESAVQRGTKWLTGHQAEDGAWRTVHSGQGGAEKGEGMWAVLGLVSMDVMSVAVKGLTDGTHVQETMSIDVEARDNATAAVDRVELFVDDLPVARQCGASLHHAWSTRTLSEGKHVVDVVATNVKGQSSRRRYELYAGNAYLTEEGTRFDERRQVSEIAFRNLLDGAAKVELGVFAVDPKDGTPGKKVFTTEQQGSPGAMAFTWNGVGADGKPQPRARYAAELVIKDAAGKVLQKERALFFHDREEAQRDQYGEIEGQLSMSGGTGLSANTKVDLVDDRGRVVQSVHTTTQGNYRFKNVDGGKYKVRVQKDGFAAQESTVEAAPKSAPAQANMRL
ncbi:MAG TPA: carboxypeptidase regulatory-like domain-containing protein [Myxococcales bacterium]|nr:carboxypeptidase regulatory-like domain-containing protein [Myxococcales bacterium]